MNVSLTDREAEFMQILWRCGPSTVSEVRSLLTDNPAYTTVLTILRNLEAKGYVGHIEEGRAHRFQALVDSEVARTSALRALVQKLFDGSADLLVTHLVSDKRLSGAQLKRVRRLLDQKSKPDDES
ncbi:MAG TPA: BlaI/MecI/CopY family transcriptional regulator [Steroidobacteraceae bacterium]|nr:BlaI/MecI/CopY family transcriptional regulator [Steroidobacteraceae bacterium]